MVLRPAGAPVRSGARARRLALATVFPFVFAGDRSRFEADCQRGDRDACAAWVDEVASDDAEKCDDGDGWACREAATLAAPSDEQKLSLYRRGCTAGDGASCQAAGDRTLQGRGTAIDPAGALPALATACADGFGYACWSAGEAVQSQGGDPAGWYAKACALHVDTSCGEIARTAARAGDLAAARKALTGTSLLTAALAMPPGPDSDHHLACALGISSACAAFEADHPTVAGLVERYASERVPDAARPDAPAESPADPALAACFQAHVDALAGPQMRGRRPGDPGHALAEQYIAAAFAPLRVEHQELTGPIGRRAHAVLAFDGHPADLAWGLDGDSGVGSFDGPAVLLPCSAPGRPLDGDVAVFTGCEADWGDWIGRAAARRGAVAAVLVGLGRSVPASSDPLLPPLESWGRDPGPIPVLSVAAWPDPKRISGSVVIAPEYGALRNVLGILPGEGALAGETVVLGAHYDHLGVDPWGNVFAGADDNASGVAAVLCAAHRLAALPKPASRRTIVFAAFDGEEIARLGSDAFAGAHPEVAAAIVLDMVGHLDARALEVHAARSADWLARGAGPASAAGLVLVDPGDDGGPSDHAPFLWRSIPAIQLMTGTGPWYHEPTDLPSRVDAEGGARITAFTSSLLEDLAVGAAPAFSGGCGGEGDPYLGIGFRFVDPSAPTRGVQVLCVDADGPGAAFGLRRGDRIRGVYGSPVDSALAMYLALGDHWPWEPLVLDVFPPRTPGG